MILPLSKAPLQNRRRSVRTRASALTAAILAVASSTYRASAQAPEFHDYARETVVLYNTNEKSSRDLATFYARARNIPQENLVGLACSIEQSINRAEYQKQIEAPLKAAFDKNGWWRREAEDGEVSSQNKRVFALMYGMPLRILDADPAYRQDTTTASLDSELMQFGSGHTDLKGILKNPYFGSDAAFHEAEIPGLFLVGRIDGATPETAKRLITDAIEVEKTGLWGYAYVDFGKMYPQGDQWLANIAASNRNFGIPTIVDEEKALFPAGYPVRDPALYYGWYSRKLAGMPGQGTFQFRKGAVACHIYSFSATNLRKPDKVWVSRLLELGAATVLGNVSEPYLGLTTHLDKFNAALLKGRTVAEACHAATPGLSWMNILCGDPLYRPFAVHQSVEAGKAPKSSEFAAEYKLFHSATQAWLKGDPNELVEKIDRAGSAMRSSTILESLGLLAAAAGQKEIASAAFKKALGFARSESDQMRVRLHGVQLILESKSEENQELAAKALKSMLSSAKEKHIQNGIRGYLNRINPPPPDQPKQKGKATPKKRNRKDKKKN